MPQGTEWVVHFTNSGAGAVDLAMTIARTCTGNLDLLALRSGYRGPLRGTISHGHFDMAASGHAGACQLCCRA